MPAIRKTRQQKIVAAQRQRDTVKPNNHPSMGTTGASTSPALDPAENLKAVHSYVFHYLQHIGWITLACLALLLAATIWLSDLSWFSSLRTILHLGTLTIR